MRNLSLNLRCPRGYRRITPLAVSTLSWLNGAGGGMSGQDKNTMNNDTQDTPSADVGQDDAPTPTTPEGPGTHARICETVLHAAHAVNRHYTERLARRRSRTGGPR